MTNQEIKIIIETFEELDILLWSEFSSKLSLEQKLILEKLKKQLTLTDVVVSFCQCTELNNYNDEIMGYDTCIKCDKPIDR